MSRVPSSFLLLYLPSCHISLKQSLYMGLLSVGAVLAKGRGGFQEESPALDAAPTYDRPHMVMALPAHRALFLSPVKVEGHLNSGISVLRSQVTDTQNIFCVIQIF